jgi:hypothetical protein
MNTMSEDNVSSHSNPLEALFALLDVFPEDGPLPPVDGELVAWQNLEVGCEYLGCSTGFGGLAEPQRFKVTAVTNFPDGGAMIWTENPMCAWGVGAYCESAVGPRCRFWRV